MTEQEEREELWIIQERLTRRYVELSEADVMNWIERYEILITLSAIDTALGEDGEWCRAMAVRVRERI